MDDCEDVKNHINKASESTGTLDFIWDNFDVLIETKIKLFTPITLNFLLRGKDNWISNKEDVKKIEMFQNKFMSRILQTMMLQVKEDRSTNVKIRSRFNNVSKVEENWRNRQILFLGSVV